MRQASSKIKISLIVSAVAVACLLIAQISMCVEVARADEGQSGLTDVALPPWDKWVFSPGNVTWKPDITHSPEAITLSLPAMSEGQYYSSFAVTIPLEPNSLYEFSSLVESNRDTQKDVIRLYESKSNRRWFGQIKKGSRAVLRTFITGEDGGTLEIALLAGNSSFEREAQVVTFSDVLLRKAPLAELEMARRLTTRDTAYKTHLSARRFKNRRVLDKTMSDFRPLPLAEKFRVPQTQYTFSPDELPQPEPEKLKGWKADKSVVRRLPYPFFTAFTIPSDACGTSNLEDTLLSSSSFFREYGLDFSGSFFAHGVISGQQPTFFNSDSQDFTSNPAILDKIKESKLFTMLTMYYRGWLDHLHSWSTGNLRTYSLLDSPVTVSCPKADKTEIVLWPFVRSKIKGLAAELSISPGVEGFCLDLEDNFGRTWQMRWNWEPVDESTSSVWDISDKNMEEINAGPSFLHFDQETFSSYPTMPVVEWIESASISVRGTPGATVKVNSIVPFNPTRAMIQQQAQLMTQANILPCAWTYHGGFSAWHNLLPTSLVAPQRTARTDGRKYSRVPRGGQIGTPAYCADIVGQFGCRMLNGVIGIGRYPAEFAQGSEEDLAVRPRVFTSPDGSRFFLTGRDRIRPEQCAVPMVSGFGQRHSDIGSQIPEFFRRFSDYGQYGYHYTHFNMDEGKAFSPEITGSVRMHEVRRHHPYAVKALELASNLTYNLDGNREFWQRPWIGPFSVLLRHQYMMRQLPKHVRLEGDTIHVSPWDDELDGKQFPDMKFVTQDLHGATFYVPDSAKARVYVAGREITNLKRNPEDFTARQSVTIIDTSAPTSVFDEVDFYERNGRMFRQGVSYYLQMRNAYTGRYSMEIQADSDGGGEATWEPFALNSYETGFLRFAYRKNNPDSKITIRWTSQTDPDAQFVVTEGDLAGRQGWEIPHRKDTEYHEVIVDYVDMQSPASGDKKLPRCQIDTFSFGLTDCDKGDSAFFDRVEFLGVRGVRPTAPQRGVVISGQVDPAEDGLAVTLEVDGQTRTTTTGNGGWYWFMDVPRDAVFTLVCSKEGIPYYPARGRVLQAVKNDVEYHVNMADRRCNSIPRSFDMLEGHSGKVESWMAPKNTSPPKELKEAYGSRVLPHSKVFYAGNVGWDLQYLNEFQSNNMGFYDKDRRSQRPDKAFRIMLVGACWAEGSQTAIGHHYGTVLESMLRRQTGRNVEVIVVATSNATIGTNSETTDKLIGLFEPDVMVLMSNYYATEPINGSINQKIVGWDPKHSP